MKRRNLSFYIVLCIVYIIFVYAGCHVYFTGPNVPQVISNSTCSVEALKRGAHQKVVSFSYYGNISRYFLGIETNAALMETIYPGWLMRLYHDADETTLSMLTEVQRRFPQLDLCRVTDIPAFSNVLGGGQMTWRFYPMADPQVDVFVSRDLDSTLSRREKDAVDEWMDSNLIMHIMRDHPLHNAYVLGGMWGAKVHLNRHMLLEVAKGVLFLKPMLSSYGQDQVFLRMTLWKILPGSIMQHDSFFCTFKPFMDGGNMRPWPTRRPDIVENFVGYSILYDTLETPCPQECRPKNHTDWTLC